MRTAQLHPRSGDQQEARVIQLKLKQKNPPLQQKRNRFLLANNFAGRRLLSSSKPGLGGQRQCVEKIPSKHGLEKERMTMSLPQFVELLDGAVKDNPACLERTQTFRVIPRVLECTQSSHTEPRRTSKRHDVGSRSKIDSQKVWT
jgi:hypothetical protein